MAALNLVHVLRARGVAVLAVALLLATACSPATGPNDSGPVPTGATGFTGHATAGPTCPVVRPNDPACAERPVVGATIHVLDARGTEVARLVTDATGGFGLATPAGTYRLVADPVEGILGTPGPVDVQVGAGIQRIDLAYDTGIR